MIGRLFWFVAGGVTAVYALLKTRRAARRFTPSGLADHAGAAAAGARVFAEQVRAGMAEREQQLHHQLALAHRRPLALRSLQPAAREDAAASERAGR